MVLWDYLNFPDNVFFVFISCNNFDRIIGQNYFIFCLHLNKKLNYLLLNLLIVEILGKYCGNIEEILGKYWEYIGEILGKYCGNIGKILGKYWRYIGKILGKYKRNIGEILEKYWRNIIKKY